MLLAKLAALFHPLSGRLRQGLAGPHPRYAPEENYAVYRYGPTPPALRRQKVGWLKFVKRRRADFARTWDRLADDESREVLLECLLFQVLGWEQMKRRRNTPEYQALVRTLPESCPRYPILEARVLARRRRFLHLYDIPEMGLRLATNEAFFLNVLQNRQYHLERADVTLRVEPGDVVLDGGTGLGDTAILFAHEAGPAGRVFTFDFAPSNLLALEKNLSLNPALRARVVPVIRALSDRGGVEIPYDDRGTETCLDEGGTERTLTISIDDFVEETRLAAVDFIKMDIEGAEESALRGATRTLRTYRPKLAISAYHRLEDLFALPECIASIEPNYRFWLDHHTIHQEETVLYADARG
jgi:FkbM family methyltransferase